MPIRICIALLTLLLGTAALAGAGEVRLANGDRLSGALTAAEEALTVETPYAGAVSLPWDQIRRVVPGESLQGAAILERIAGEQDIALGPAVECSEPTPGDTDDADAPETGESGVDPAATSTWSGFVETGASFRTGETDAVDANAALELTRHWTQQRLILKANYTYGEVDSQVNTRRVSGSLRLEHDFRPRLYGYLQTRAAHDPAEKLDLRIGASAGLGWQFMDREETSLKADLGLGYTRERWNTFSLTDWEREKVRVEGARLAALRDFATHLRGLRANPPNPWTFGDAQALLQRIPPLFQRASQEPWNEDRMELHLGIEYRQALWRATTLAESFSFQADAGDFGDYRFQSSLSLTTPLNDRLSLVLRLVTDYVSPSTEREKVFNNTFTFSGRYAL